jgi:two-component system sensor histidine kinase PilS (NtrC family)
VSDSWRAEGHAEYLEDRLRGRLTRLLAARIALIVAVFAAALFIEAKGRGGSEAVYNGLYTTVALAFLATAIYGALLARARRTDRLRAVQLVTDVAIVTSLVHFSGGNESIFTFLYVPVVAYAAILFDRRGAMAAAALAAAAHGAALLTTQLGLVPGFASPAAPLILMTRWGVLAGAMFLGAFLASALSRDLHRVDAALDARTTDLRRLRNLHERIVESLTSGLLTTGPDGRITSFNREAERISGARAGDVVGVDVDDVLPGSRALLNDRPETQSPGGQRQRIAFTNRRGDALHLGLAGSVLRDADGRSSGWVVIFQDLTQVVRMEEDLRRSERLAAAGQLAADMAHEVRNPLAAISGSIQMLSGNEAGQSREEGGRLMEIVLREADRLNVLIADFLAYARPAPPKLEPVDVGEVVDEVIEMFDVGRPVDIEIAREIEAGIRALVDSAQLRQLLWNLVLNAAQAMPNGGRLVVSATALPQEKRSEGRNVPGGEGSGTVQLCVSDTGSGIPPDVLDRIFDPFFTTKRGGTGLGLSTVHRIIEGNGGSVRVETEPGAGTTFRVELARAEGIG